MRRKLRQLTDNPAAAIEKLVYLLTHPWALFWHPHQGVWNGYISLVSLGLLKYPSIWCDTAVRYLSAAMKPNAAVQEDSGQRLVYLDIGLHREATQARLFIDWFGRDWDMLVLGYEAHPQFADNARTLIDEDIRGMPRVTAKVMNMALVGPDVSDATIELFLDDKDGKGNSLLSDRGSESIRVPAARLSDQLREHGVDTAKDIVILRMNIEGAELFVLQDLVSAGLVHSIAGYYGMWNDLFKISPRQDRVLRRLLRDHRLHPFPFNERDLTAPNKAGFIFRLRERAIRMHLEKTIRVKAAELRPPKR